MGRMHSRGKGISKSALPYKRTPPSWLKVTPEEVEEQICKFAKKGLTPSEIGVILRDSHGIAQVRSVTGAKILRILKKNGACNFENNLHSQLWRFSRLTHDARYHLTLGTTSVWRGNTRVLQFRNGSWNSWGFIQTYQESCRRPKTFGTESSRQRLEISSDSDRVSNSSTFPLLSCDPKASTTVDVPIVDRFDFGRVELWCDYVEQISRSIVISD